MTQKELSLLFPSNCHKEGLLLLVPPSKFHKLEGKTIEKAVCIFFYVRAL